MLSCIAFFEVGVGNEIMSPYKSFEHEGEHEDDFGRSAPSGNEIRLLRAGKIKYKPGCCLGWMVRVGDLWRRNRISLS